MSPRWSWKRMIWGMVTALCLFAVCAPGPSGAQAADEITATGTVAVEGAGDEAGAEAWWGVAGAVLCGGGAGLIRTYPVIGMNPYVLAATLGGCILMVMDIAS